MAVSVIQDRNNLFMETISGHIGEWLASRPKEGEKNNAIVTNKRQFGKVADLLYNQDNIAFISIESTSDVADYYHYKDNKHYLPSGDNVLNLEFDDVDNTLQIAENKWARTISEEQAEQIVDFIERHLGYDFIIHCRAGKSRSQAIYRYIMDVYTDLYEESFINAYNRCSTPNIDVLAKLKRAFRKRSNS